MALHGQLRDLTTEPPGNFQELFLPSSPFLLSGESVENGNLKLAPDLGGLCDPAELTKAW